MNLKKERESSSARQPLQLVLLYLFYMLLGVLAFGSVLGAITDAITIISFEIALYSTVLVLVFWCVMEFLVAAKKVRWRFGKSVATISGLGPKIRLPLIGALLLLWVPVLTEEQHPDSIEPMLRLANLENKIGTSENKEGYRPEFEKELLPPVVLDSVRQEAQELFDLFPEEPSVLIALGDLDAARRVLEKERARKTKALSKNLRLAGITEAYAGDYRTAEAHLEEALRIEPNDRCSSVELAMVLTQAGSFPRAQEIYRNLLDSTEKYEYPGCLDAAILFKNIGHLSYLQGDYRDAISRYDQAIEAAEGRGDIPSSLASIKAKKSLALYDLGKYEEARTVADEALTIANASPGVDRMVLAECLHQRALVARIDGALESAKSLYLQSIEVADSVGLARHPETAMTFQNLGALFFLEEDFDEALRYYRFARLIWEESLGPGHPQIALVLNNQATAMTRSGQGELAVALLQRARGILESHGLKAHTLYFSILTNIGKANFSLGAARQAVESYTEAIEGLVSALGPGHAFVGITALGLAEAFEGYGKPGNARVCSEFGFRVIEGRLGAGHSEALRLKQQYGRLGKLVGVADSDLVCSRLLLSESVGSEDR